MIIYDDDNDIALYKIYQHFGTLLASALTNNESYKTIFRETGISSLIENYCAKLTPFLYNGRWQNDNPQFNAEEAFYELYLQLDEKHRFLFLKSIIEHSPRSRVEDEKTSNYLLVLGYSLDYDYDKNSKHTLSQTESGIAERSEDIPLLERKIKEDYPDLFRFYDEALSTFGNGEYKSCIDNCRSLFEQITKGVSSESSTDKAILNIAQESAIDINGNPTTSKDKIYEYWVKNKKGANRFRYFTTLYSVMSGLGTHGEDIPTKKDAVLILRAFEDVLVWILL